MASKITWHGWAVRAGFFLTLISIVWLSLANSYSYSAKDFVRSRRTLLSEILDTAGTDTTEVDLVWPVDDNPNPSDESEGIIVPLPDNIEYQVEYNPITGEYEVVQSVGGTFDYRPKTTMTLDEYLEYNMAENVSEYWQHIQEEEDEANRDFVLVIPVGPKDGGFGNIEIRPQGSAELTFGLNISKTDNPRIPERQRRITTFNFDQKIQLNVQGNIGDKLKLNVNYNTESTFDFENQMKLEFNGDEDKIIRHVELGNVSLPLKGTLITGSSSLFGAKIETQWGKLKNTTVASQQKGERKEINIQGGAQTQKFEITGDNYEANRHYFLSGWFRDQYDQALSSLPVVNSGINITRIEVWVVNTQANTQDVRNVIAVTDLGEAEQYMNSNLPLATNELQDRPDIAVTPLSNPSNLNNDIFLDMIENDAIMNFTGANAAIGTMYPFFDQGVHYERVGNARKLNTSEFSYNSRLGFISLRQSLNNAEVLGVSYEYTLNGQTYQVGTLSQDGFAAPQALILKMLKSSITQVRLDNGNEAPLWDLMMKNVYSLGAFGVSQENFRLDVWYNNPATGVDQNYIPREPLNTKPLIQILNLDRIDINQMSGSDGFFDFIPNAQTTGGLIDTQTGRIYFPVVEPFGSHLSDQIIAGLGSTAAAEALISQIVYQPLYDSTKVAAQQIPALNRFKIKGQYQSASGSEISLNALNIPQGSVSVTAGGLKLTEGVDYTVDYNLGRVRIINDGVMASGQPIKVSVESNSMFNLQFKTMLGSRFDYAVNDDLALGATILNLRERPVTQKVNMGDEPVNNTIMGLDVNYKKDSPFLTQLVDRLPFLETKAKSSIDFSAEGAYLIPGHSRAISKDGNAYLDDFEGSQSVIDIRNINQWFMASTPKLQNNAGGLFPEGGLEDSLAYGYNRARLSWYVIDPLFFRGTSITPNSITDEVQSNHFMREVLEGEVFPNRELPPGTPPNIATLDLSYYPNERGPYNYEQPLGTAVSSGLNPDGTLLDPESRWGGIQRALTTTDFEASNIEFIQFWLMDPFNQDSENINGGDLYFNLGNVSEDVLNDSQLSFENGLPNSNNPLPTDTSNWSVYPDPSTLNVVNAFDNSTGSYSEQDIGLDGVNSQNESSFFADWLSDVQGHLDPNAFTPYANDPSADDYLYFRSEIADTEGWNTVQRYKFYNNNEGNSNTSSPDDFPITATTIPNTEDINQDITLNTIESYFQYHVSLKPQDLGEVNIGKNYITDSFVTTVPTQNGDEREIRWYQFKIPVRDFDARFGGIADFRSIRYIRMFMKGWAEPTTLRFARLELVRGEWRKYLNSLAGPQEIEPNDDEPTIFNIAAVNIEENGNREPVPYAVPPGIIREQDVASANLRSLNEQSLSYEVCNLQDGDARAAYRNVNFDMRQYKKLRMFAHAEALGNEADLTDKDVTVFIRLGSDFDQNYYEYELPMTVTPWYTGDDDVIWPEANNFDISLRDLQDLKVERGTGSTQIEYSKMVDNARISVKGNPNMANVSVLLIGVRNPDRDKNTFEGGADDGRSKCAIIWVNELRLSEFDERGGWAAVARMNATLADFGNIAVAGNISKPGWGTLEQRVQERQQETIMGFDANSTLQMGKFFPENWGVSLPMYLGYSETVRTPRYSPLQPDLELADLPNLSKPLKKKSQDYTKRRSINFTNVRISPKGGAPGSEKGGEEKGKEGEEKGKGEEVGKGEDPGKGKTGGQKKDQFYDIKNFSVSYSFNEEYRSDINTDWRLNKRYKGGFDYSFSNKPKEIKPFGSIGFVKNSKYLKWIKDFNFFPGIKQLGFHTDMDRTYETTRLRNNTLELFGTYSDMLIQTQVLKQWNWTRQYTFKYDLTKSIKFEYLATNMALVGEPRGVIDKENTDWYEAYKDTVMSNLQNWGETTTFNHSTSVSYKLPFDKFPIVDFVTGDARYGSTYRWDRAPFTQDSLGNTIQNSRNIQLNGQANFVSLYNKVPLLKEINQGKKKDDKKKDKDKDKVDGFGDEDPDKAKKEKVDPINPLHVFLRLLMTVQNVSGNYTRNEGLLLPGYNKNTKIIGMDENFEGPGYGFIFGQQNTDIWGNETGNNFALGAAENGWLTQAPFLNQQYTETFSETWNIKANLEPIKHFKVEINATRTENRNMASFFRFNEDTQQYEFQSPLETGNLNASIITWPTAFMKDDPENGYTNEVFETFLDNRLVTTARLNEINYALDTPEANGYYQGFGPTSQNVVIPAFIAAYTGKSPEEVSLDPFKTKVQPNWTVTYDGLTKLPAIKKYFKQFNLKHTYRSNITTNYVNNLNYEADTQGRPTELDQSEFPNFISQRQINTVTITEQMTPFIGFDMTINNKKKNEPQLKVEYKRDRTIALGLTNYQITETKGNSMVFGVGYKIKDIPNPFGRAKGSKLPIKLLEKTDINIRIDFTIRDNSTLIRRIVEQQNQVTAGQRLYSIKTSADMNVSDKLTIRFFYDHQITKPKISTSFPTSNISTGLSLRFSLNN
jgi:hypothetical protein